MMKLNTNQERTQKADPKKAKRGQIYLSRPTQINKSVPFFLERKALQESAKNATTEAKKKEIQMQLSDLAT